MRVAEYLKASLQRHLVTVFVPADGAGAAGIHPGSAMTGKAPALPFRGFPPLPADELTIVYYEGAIYSGDSNTSRSFRERLICAGGRLLTRYPTTAMVGLPTEQLQPVGVFDTRLGVMAGMVDGGEDALARWVALDPRQAFDCGVAGDHAFLNLGRVFQDLPDSPLGLLAKPSRWPHSLLSAELPTAIEEAAVAYETLGLPKAAAAIRQEVADVLAAYRARVMQQPPAPEEAEPAAGPAPG